METSISASDLENLAFPNEETFPMENNYTITKLTFYLSPGYVERFDLSVLPYLKKLDLSRVLSIDPIEFKLLVSRVEQPLNIKRLPLTFRFQEDIEFAGIGDLFNLKAITSLELMISDNLGHFYDYSQFYWLFKNLPNLTHLCLIADSITINRILDLVKKNTLSSLTMGLYNYTSSLRIPKLVWNQEKSIQRFQLSLDLMISSSLLDEFSQICKLGHQEASQSPDYQRIIKDFLKSDIKRFPNLRHFIISKCHYEVEKKPDIGFKAIPINH